MCLTNVNIGVAVINSQMEEILHLSLRDMILLFSFDPRPGQKDTIGCTISAIQLDSQLPSAPHPILLRSLCRPNDARPAVSVVAYRIHDSTTSM
jgi:hypothetical protein